MALMPIPTLALLPIIIILFGIGDFSKVVTIAGSVFFPVVINTAAGVINIDSIYLDVAKNYGVGKLNFFLKIALPGAMPVMLEGIQMGQAIALLTIVAAEMMGANVRNRLSNLDFIQSIPPTRDVCRAHPHFVFRLFVLTSAPGSTEKDVTVEVSN